MSKSSSQNGSAHIIIVAVLGVALAGALGYIFWQNFIDKPVNEKNTETVKEQTKLTDVDSSDSGSNTPAESANKLEEGYFAIEAWNIQLKQPSAYVKYYEVKDGEREYLGFTTKAVQELGGMCAIIPSANEPGNMLAMLYRQKTKPEVLASAEYIGQVDDYYYIASGSQAPCSEKNVDLQTKDREILWQMVKSIKALN